MIYIDPPYNTGNKDFIYNDRFVDKEDDFRHSKWLSFMEKRLKLAKDLLNLNGVIFISIDDNEYAPLRMLCDELFNKDNFVATFKWNRTAKAPSLSDSVRIKYEYVLCYRKEKPLILFGKNSYNTQAPLLNISNRQVEIVFPPKSIKIPNGFTPGKYSEKYKVELIDRITVEDEFNKSQFRIKACFKWSQNKINAYIKSGKYFLVKKDLSTIYYFLETEGSFIPPSDLISDEECGVKRNTDAKEETKNLGINFDYAKPVSLIKYLIKSATYNKKEALILDFMAGSGTTGQATMELNAEDKGTRNFILCTNNGDEKSEHKIASDVCYPRIKKVINGYKNQRGEKVEGLGGNLRYFKTAFVPKDEVSDNTRRSLVARCTDMIRVRENAFTKKQDNKRYKIYTNEKIATGILFDLDAIEEFKKKLSALQLPAQIYVFSLTSDTFADDFADLLVWHTLCPIPESILEVYRKLFK